MLGGNKRKKERMDESMKENEEERKKGIKIRKQKRADTFRNAKRKGGRKRKKDGIEGRK